jgi:putative nucleotidyltransferase with HDIG domain
MSQEQQSNRIKSKKVELILQQLGNLPTLPAVATRLLQLTVQSTTHADEVIQLIESDPSLASKIITLTTQMTKNTNRQVVTSVSKAVILLGFETVRNAVLSIKVFETLGQSGDEESKGFDRTEFWKHCLAVACAAKKIIPALDKKIDPEEAFLCGLLHDLGKVALDSCLPKSISRVVQIAQSTLTNIAEVEQRILGIDHATAGKRLAQKWGLPQSVVESIWLHHQHLSALPESIKYRSVVRAVHLADVLAREQRVGFSGNPVFNESSVSLAQELGCPQELIEGIARELRQEVADRVVILGLDELEPDEMFQEALSGANRELGKLNGHLQVQNRKLQIRSQYFDLLCSLGNQLSPEQSVVEVAGIIAELWQGHVGSQNCAVYGITESGKVFEGTAMIAGEDEPLVFLVEDDVRDIDQDEEVREGREALSSLLKMQAVGETHGWFFEQVTGVFDVGMTWWIPLMMGGRLVGGILWEQKPGAVGFDKELKELNAFSGSAAMALSQAQALEAQNTLCEELVNINRLLIDTREELMKKKSLATIGEMAGGAAHEINNPLAVIVGRSQLLASSEEDGKRKKMLEAISDQGQAITGIINELMYFAKPLSPKPHSVDPKKMMEQALAEVKSLGHDKHIEFKVEWDDEVMAVFVDEGQIAGALIELLTNAINAYDSGGGLVQIKGVLDELSHEVRLEIMDQGSGMDSVTLEKAFTPFFSNKSAGRNRGLGLSRCVRAIESNGGRLQLVSDVGQGTVARIGLPILQVASVEEVEV